MHELALCAAIAATVGDHAGGAAVRAVNVEIGHLRQVVPETLQFCWTLHNEGTPLQGCELVVDHVPAAIRCRGCGDRTVLEEPLLVCGSCDGTDVELTSGEELSVTSIDVDRRAR